jgi:hypothetical protein
VTGRRGRRRKKLLDDLKEMRGYSHLMEEALDRTIWRARFGRCFGPVVRQTAKWLNMYVYIYIYIYYFYVLTHAVVCHVRMLSRTALFLYVVSECCAGQVSYNTTAVLSIQFYY